MIIYIYIYINIYEEEGQLVIEPAPIEAAGNICS